MKEILNELCGKIGEIAPLGTFVDINLGQLMLEQPPVSFPCALVDVEDIEYSEYKGGGQLANATISVTLGFNIYAPSDINADADLRAQAMAHYDIVKQISSSLNGYEGSCFTRLFRRSIKRGAENYPRTFTIIYTTKWVEKKN